jgi:hypothetical protein
MIAVATWDGESDATAVGTTGVRTGASFVASTTTATTNDTGKSSAALSGLTREMSAHSSGGSTVAVAVATD